MGAPDAASRWRIGPHAVAPADGKRNDKGSPALTKWYFNSWLVLGPLKVEEGQKRLLGFDPLSSDSVKCTPIRCVMPCLWDIAHKRSLATL